MNTHTHARTHTDSHTYARAHTRTHTHTHTHTHTLVAYQGTETEERVFKKRKVFKEDLKELTQVEWREHKQGVKLAPDNWSLVREEIQRWC